MAYDTKAALAAGVSQQEINAYLAQKKMTSKPKVGGLKGFVANALPTIGGALGAIGGSFVAPIAGTAAGGAAGAGLGEFARQKLLGEKSDYKSMAVQSVLGALPGVAKGVGAGVSAIKGASAAKATAQAAQAAKAAESMAAATKAQNVAKVAGGLGVKGSTAKQIPVTFQDATTMAKVGAPKTTVTNRLAVNPTVGDVADIAATPGTTAKLGSIRNYSPTTGSYQTPYVSAKTTTTKVPVSTPESYTTTKQILPEARAIDMPAPATTTAPKAAAPVVEPVTAPKQGIAGNVKQSALDTDKEISLGRVGRPTGNGKVYTAEQQAKEYEFMRNGSKKYVKNGIKPGKPIAQSRQAERVHNEIGKRIDSELDRINAPVAAGTKSKIVTNMRGRMAKDSTVRGDTSTGEKIISEIENAKDYKALEKLRRKYDREVWKGNSATADASTTNIAAQNKIARQEISKVMKGLSPEYDALKADYGLAKKVAENTARASNSSRGLTVFGVHLGRQSIPGAASKAAAMTAKGASVSGKAGMAMPFVKATGAQVAGRALASPFVPETAQQQEDAKNQAAIDEYMASPEAAAAAMQQSGMTDTGQPEMGPFQDPQKVQQAYFAALTAGDTKTAAAILDGYKMFSELNAGAGGEKPLSAEASKVVAGANAGLQAIDLLKGEMASNPGVQQKTAIPGRGLMGGAGNRVLGTGTYQAAMGNILDSWARIKTGAAISNTEEGRFNANLPQPFDSDEVVQQKLQIISDLFTSVANRTGTAGTEMQAATGVAL